MKINRLSGVLFALGAFILWGLFPLYWKQLIHVEPLEVLAHRVVWSVPFVGAVVLIGGKFGLLLEAFRNIRGLAILAISSLLISLNWGVYIWAVSVDRVVEASMGYFLTPLLSVVLGLLIFGERLHRIQWAAVSIAATGVLYLFVAKSVPPWVALILGISFASYGAIRKQAVQDSVTGLFVELLAVFPIALLYLIFLGVNDMMGFSGSDFKTDLLLIGAGVVTASPVLLFVAGARQLHLSTVGLLFYLTPTIQFLIGILVYDETLLPADLIAFICIWTALVLFASHGYIQSRHNQQTIRE